MLNLLFHSNLIHTKTRNHTSKILRYTFCEEKMKAIKGKTYKTRLSCEKEMKQ